MPALMVPQLRRKLDLLIEHGHYNSWIAIAEALGRDEVTVRGWVNGRQGTPPDRIPRGAVDGVLDLYAKALPDLARDHIRALLRGPADDLEAILSGLAAETLTGLIEREADRTSGRLILDDGGISLVQVKSAGRSAPTHEVDLGRWFRLEFQTTSRGGFVLALQSAPGGWGCLPCAFDREARLLHVPGFNKDGKPDFMRETGDPGHHRFVALQAGRPFPAEFAAAVRERATLHQSLLAFLATQYELQDKDTRRVFVLDIEIFD